MKQYKNQTKQSMGLFKKDSFNKNVETSSKSNEMYHVRPSGDAVCLHCFLSGLLASVDSNRYVLRLKDLPSRERNIFYNRLTSNTSLDKNSIDEMVWGFEIIDSAIRIYGCDSLGEAMAIVASIAQSTQRNLELIYQDVTLYFE
jgi:hypothetical protein